jgi:hypothetical protein
MILNRNINLIVSKTKIAKEWALKLIDKLCYWNIIFELLMVI